MQTSQRARAAESASQETNLLTALQTTFSKDADPEMFLARTADKIAQLERTIVTTCSKHRIRVDDNLYTLLESRDAIAEQEQDVSNSVSAASEITASIDDAVTVLTEKMHVRRNLDAALAVAAQTRKLTRMYARIEDTIDARRLYTAFRMLEVLEEETRAVKPGTVLRELVPDCQQLRATIALHARKALQSWLETIPRFEEELGGYALYDASKKSGNVRSLATLCRVHARGEAMPRRKSVSPKKGNAAERSEGRRDRTKAWSPLLPSSLGHTGTSLPRGFTRSSFTSQSTRAMEEIGATPSGSGSVYARSGDAGDDSLRWFATDKWEEVPRIHLRALLQSVLVNKGLEHLEEVRSDYGRERQAHLKQTVDDLMDEWSQRDADESEISTERMRRMEDCVVRVCGVFVVERAVERYAAASVLQRAVVNEWWMMAQGRMGVVFREVEMGGEVDSMWARALGKAVEAFAEVNGLAIGV